MHGVSGKVCWGVVGGEGSCGKRYGGRCREVCLGVEPQHTFPHLLPTLTFPYISPYLLHTPTHFPTPPLIPLPTSPLPPPHIFLLFPHLPSPSQRVAKLPCGKVPVTSNRCQMIKKKIQNFSQNSPNWVQIFNQEKNPN